MTATPSPFEDGGTTITLKADKGYDAPWLVFKGSPAHVRGELLITLGMKDDPEKALVDLLVEADVLFKAQWHAGTQLGATVVSKPAAKKAASSKKAAEKDEVAAGDSVQVSPEESSTEHPVLTLIAETTNADELKLVWASNQDAFKDESVIAAYKKQGQGFAA